MSPTLGVKQTSSPKTMQKIDLVPENDGILQKVRVYSLRTKDGIVEIIGSAAGKILIIKAQICETGSRAVVQVREASRMVRARWAIYAMEAENTFKAKTVMLQDGFVYFKSAVQGRMVYIKAQVAQPIKSCVFSFYCSSQEKMAPALQKLNLCYVKVQSGIAGIVGAVGGRIVVIKAKIHDRYASSQAWTFQSIDGARAALDGYTSPLLSKAVSLRQHAATKVDHIFVSFRDGVVHVNGVVGEQMLHLQTKLSETAICKSMSKGLQATLEVTTNLMEAVSDALGKGRDRLKFIQCSIKDRVLYIAYRARDRLVVVRIKVSEVTDYMKSRSLELYAATHASLADVCWEAKTTMRNATAATRTRALEAGNKIRSVAADRDAQAAAAGAVAMGTSAGATGLLAGGALGAAAALPAAFFTFGLSIPVGAMVGAGSGLCIAGSAGFVAGGAAGYKASREKESIGKSISSAFEKAKARKTMAVDSASNLRLRVVGKMGGAAFA
jgi:hypothetical protein